MGNENLNSPKYHCIDLSGSSFLITGGAGFIGSNIVDYLIRNNAGLVRVLDNLSNGYYENIKAYARLSNFEFIEGDIRSLDTCKKAVSGMNYVSHQAALGSVPRSILDPITSNEVNVGGFLNIINCVKNEASVKRFVYAASSSTYGDSRKLPKVEGNEGNVLSPYAVTKLVNELYAEVFYKIYDFKSIGLRYFNVFGPKQNPNNPYAAVIPLFCKHFLENTNPIIYGDGLTTRDFTYIENVVQANIKSLLTDNLEKHEVFNIACGEQTSLIEIIEYLVKISNRKLIPRYENERVGDIKHSKADISKAIKLLNYNPSIFFEEGITKTYNWYKSTN